MEERPDSKIVKFPTDPEDKGKNFSELKRIERRKEADWLQHMLFNISNLTDLDELTDEEIDNQFDPKNIERLGLDDPMVQVIGQVEFTSENVAAAIDSLQRLKARMEKLEKENT